MATQVGIEGKFLPNRSKMDVGSVLRTRTSVFGIQFYAYLMAIASYENHRILFAMAWDKMGVEPAHQIDIEAFGHVPVHFLVWLHA
jgi:hypothetical protein